MTLPKRSPSVSPAMARPSKSQRNEQRNGTGGDIEDILSRCSPAQRIALDRLQKETKMTEWLIAETLKRKPPALPYLSRDILLTEEIAPGSSCTVFGGVQKRLKREVAIKAVKNTDLSRARREAQIAGQFSSNPHSITVYDAFEAAGDGDTKYGNHFLVMERGELTLRHYLEQKGTLTLVETLKTIRSLAEALLSIHSANIVHRDIKPGNMFIDPRTFFITLFDYGIAGRIPRDSTGHTRDDHSLTIQGTALGTAHYMSPEAFRDAWKTNEQSDIYSLGCVAFTLLHGEPMFAHLHDRFAIGSEHNKRDNRSSFTQEQVEIPRKTLTAIENMFQTTVDPSPKKRPQSAKEIIDTIDDALPRIEVLEPAKVV